ncbi:hypothetical protein BEP19_07345 [Ammoniphilus oxalaticus]|uniref:RNA polymerase sigma-70 domain-containing protein n=1 Tax=Ammoniphilus oxalaticus TaxID=66863 RepID=A0A419SJR9_9BACL|nr:FliA/WhiG family RNA polymerase sigma factor [Ammoniphilus oxalaticus]RKD24212.1 hypothetical protein BEP19_07345 [Ammoniphilus oxalaticus]
MAMNLNRQKELAADERWWEAWTEKRDLTAREHLTHRYMPVVHRIATRIKLTLPQMVDKDDLISWGYLGLLDALQKFDYQLGWTFETYAVPRIRGAIIDGLRGTDWVPRSIRSKARKLEEAQRSLEQAYFRAPTEAELCEHLEMSKTELQKVSRQVSNSHVVSLDEPRQHGDEDTTLMQQLVDEWEPTQVDQVEQQETRQLLGQLIEKLPEREQLVLSLIYVEELTFSHTAEVLGVTTGRISQIHSKVIARLREQFKRFE